jgi:hypothetical protein
VYCVVLYGVLTDTIILVFLITVIFIDVNVTSVLFNSTVADRYYHLFIDEIC